MVANKPDGVLMAPFPAFASPEDIDGVFDLAAVRKLPAIVVLPGVRTEHELAGQLLALADGQRWSVHRVPRPTALDTDDVFVGIEWLTSAGHWSSPMGLAPLGTMPATRRAPYTCIAAWTGGHDNRFRKRVEPVVHFLDVDLSAYRLTSERYTMLRKTSEKASTDLLFDDSAAHYRNVAYRLSTAVADVLSLVPLRS